MSEPRHSKDDRASPKIGIVIAVFNRLALTRACLASLAHLSYPNYKIVIVDDGSTDGTADALIHEFPEVLLERGDGTLWWSHAMNMGIERALGERCEFVLFLNNDDEVSPDILDRLLECAEMYKPAVVGCKVRENDDRTRLVFAGGDVDWERRGLIRFGAGEIDEGQYDRRRAIKWIPGAGTFVHADVFRRIGLIDHRWFRQYRGDIDFTLRASAAGIPVIFEPAAVLYKNMDPETRPSSLQRLFLVRLVVPLFSVRSQMAVVPELRFHWRHCPKRFIARRLCDRYVPYYRAYLSLGVLRRLLAKLRATAL